MAPLPRTRVLVVATTSASRDFQRDILERAGFAVAMACNGVEAVERFLAQPCDLVIAEVDMPSMDGFTLVRTLRQEGVNADVPVVLTTPELLPDQVKRSGQVGANLLLGHPMPAETLVEVAAMMTGRPVS